MQVKCIAEHSTILATFITLLFVIKIFVLYIFKWSFYTDLTVYGKRSTPLRTSVKLKIILFLLPNDNNDVKDV